MSAVKDTHRGAKESLNIDDVGRLIKSARASIHSGTIHSCQLCSVQELDPLRYLETDDDITPLCLVKYRGTTVLEGASNGCYFFRELITKLEHTLQKRGYGDGSGCVLEFRPKKWICELRSWNTLHWVFIEWNSVEGELPVISLPDVARRSGHFYAFVADGGKHHTAEETKSLT